MSMDRDPNIYNRDPEVYDREARGSNTLAYLIGGLVIALGLLAFLFYDGGGRDVSTTGSTTSQPTQSAPANPTAPTPAPASPLSPPASPANPTAPAPQQ